MNLEIFLLKNYLQLDGMTYKLVPILTPDEGNFFEMGRINTSKMYKNVKNWEQLFETAFKKLAQYKDEDVKLRISLALGAVYHDQGKFEIALPILKNCYLKQQF